MAGNVETEIKLAVAGAAEGRRLLEGAGFAVRVERDLETNAVFDTAEATYRSSGRLVRLRSCGDRAMLTFKGPAADTGGHKSREEVEFTVSSAVEARKFLERLGLGETYYYEKFRTEYAIDGEPGHAVLDETPVGVFLELEGPGEWIDATAARLGFAREAFVTASYAGLHAAWVRAHGGDSRAMRFL